MPGQPPYYNSYGYNEGYDDEEEQGRPQVRIGRSDETPTLLSMNFPQDSPSAPSPVASGNPYVNGQRTSYNFDTPDYPTYSGYVSSYDDPLTGSVYDQRPSFELNQLNPGQPESAGAAADSSWQNMYSYQDNNHLLSPVYSPSHVVKDPESQNYMEPGRLNVFGMSNSDEYADQEDEHYVFPINGDEYALNTWGDESTEVASDTDVEDTDNEYDNNGRTNPRKVQLFRGNLVLDCPVSDRLLSQYPEHQPVREFTHMRYSAATCDPADFVANDFTLRQRCYSSPRSTELCICITIYNEDDILLARTLQGVFNNIRHLCSRSRSKVWGSEAWKKVVVVVVSDGREKLNPRAKALMAALGVYQEGFAKNMVNDKPVEGHIYEYTTMVRIASANDTVRLTTKNAVPVQMLFCLKEKNKKKINSHRWFFQAFGPILQPKVCVLLDAGTRPGNHAIYHLWKAFDKNSQIAGACGEIAAALGKGYSKLFNPLVAAQNFEYKMSNILDKPSESVFGFITVLPGAFSAYRYEALQNDANGEGPLEKYFKGEKLEGQGGIFSANMYLAEDRILCWELVAKRNCNWVLKYVKSAKAHTDVPEHLSELILQRRRWLNGSFFAAIYAQVHMFGIWRTSHSLARKLWMHIEFLYQAISLIFSWFSIGNFFLVFKILTEAVGDPSMDFAPGHVLSIVLTWVYVCCLVTIFVLSLGNRPKGTHYFYDIIAGFFAVLMAYICFSAIYVAVRSVEYEICKDGGFKPQMMVLDKTFRDLIISLLSTYALYIIASLISLEPWHMITSFLQYILLSPAYINVFNVYAFCNTHDISWGTKGDDKVKLDLGVVKADEKGKAEVELPTSSSAVDQYYVDEINLLSSPPLKVKEEPSAQDRHTDYYAFFRSSVVLIWLFMNIALIAVVLNVGGFEDITKTSSSTATATATPAATAAAAIKLAVRDTCKPVNTATTQTTEIYLAVILWSVAGMAAYRFVCCVLFLAQWVIGH